MTIRAVLGVHHPGDGVSQPRGPGHILILPAQTGRMRGWDLRARYPVPVTGISAPGGPSYNTSGYERWVQKIPNLDHFGNTNEVRSPMGGVERAEK